MLKKLRLKFVVINMMIVTIMLGSIFSLLYFFTSNTLERESIQTLRSYVNNPMRMLRPDIAEGNTRQPYFSVIVDTDGDTIEINGGFYDVSDEETIHEIVSLCFSEKAETGVLKEYGLRYLKTDTPIGQSLVFTDITREQLVLGHLLRTLLLIGGAAFAVFLGISSLLARWAVKPVEKAWQQQKQFVADASHELKTPLTVILTDAELLQTSGSPEEDIGQLSGGIITMAEQMRGLVESLLELARLDAGSVTKVKTTVALSEVATEAAMMFEPVFFEKDLPFSYEIEQDITLDGDGTHLKQLTDILLDNAAKYASPGGDVYLTLKRTAAKKCRLEVRNRGEEIAPEDLKNLFKRFYRADKARAQNHSYGLGLSIAEHVTEEHGGKIRAESKDGYNSFSAELPCKSK